MNKWTAADIPDLSGKVAIITGANNGLGYASAMLLAEKGVRVVLAVRTPSKGETAAARIQQTHPEAELSVMPLDLADLASVHAFAAAFTATFERLDILMNNAGIMATPAGKTKDGFELQFGTNHLGHFALTGLLFETLLNTPNSRIVNVSSMAATSGQMNFTDLMSEESYSRFSAYGQSKLANLLFTIALQKRIEAVGASTISVAAHPGGAATNLAAGMRLPVPGVNTLMKLFSGWLIPNAETAALSQVRAAVAQDVEGGDYYGPDKGMRGYPVKTAMPGQVNEADAIKLWEVSEQLTGVTFGTPVH